MGSHVITTVLHGWEKGDRSSKMDRTYLIISDLRGVPTVGTRRTCRISLHKLVVVLRGKQAEQSYKYKRAWSSRTPEKPLTRAFSGAKLGAESRHKDWPGKPA
jgi:hypothetical protein